MRDENQKIREIKERLNKIAATPWGYCGASPEKGCTCGLVWSHGEDFVVAECNTSSKEEGIEVFHETIVANGRFIGHAPQDIMFLLCERDRLLLELHEEKTKNNKDLFGHMVAKQKEKKDEK